MDSRRQFLTALGASLAGLAGCPDRQPPRTGTSPPGSPTSRRTSTPDGDSETASDAPTTTEDPLADRYETIRDVTDAGVDPTGSERVDEALRELAGDDTLLRFPPGTYRLNSLTVEDVTNFGMIGSDATLKLDARGRQIHLQFRRVADLRFEGFSVDNTAENTAAWFDLKCTGGHNVVRDYAVEGFVDVAERANGFTIMVQGADTSVELDSVDLSRGARNGTATFVFPRREFMDPSEAAGSITFRNCVMKGWGKEGLYASAHEGPLRVLGGEYANNGIDQVRIGGGGADQRAVVRGVTVRVDEVPSYMPEKYRILRGIWLKEGDGALVENCEVTLANLDESQTPAAVLVKDQFGRATIRDCRISVADVSRPAVLVQEPVDSYDPPTMPSLDGLPPAWGVTLENLVVDGAGPDCESVRIEGRDGCAIRDVSIDTATEGADGIGLYRVGRCEIAGGSVTTDRYPVRIGFDGTDDCVVDVAGVSLEARSLETDGERLTGGGTGRYCVGSGALSESAEPAGDQLALTRTESESSDGETTETGGYRLRGRWLAA